MFISGGNSNSNLLKDNQVWTWGRNDYGQLGDNTTTERHTPVSILGAKKTFCTITAGQGYTIGIDKDSQVWGWGSTSYGKLGTDDTTTPIRVCGF